MTATWRATWKTTSTRSTRCRRRWPACRRLLGRGDAGRETPDRRSGPASARSTVCRAGAGWRRVGNRGEDLLPDVLAGLFPRGAGAYQAEDRRTLRDGVLRAGGVADAFGVRVSRSPLVVPG